MSAAMDDCPHQVRTTEYFDGALTGAECGEALEHIATCTACQTVLFDAAMLDALLVARLRMVAALRTSAAGDTAGPGT